MNHDSFKSNQSTSPHMGHYQHFSSFYANSLLLIIFPNLFNWKNIWSPHIFLFIFGFGERESQNYTSEPSISNYLIDHERCIPSLSINFNTSWDPSIPFSTNKKIRFPMVQLLHKTIHVHIKSSLNHQHSTQIHCPLIIYGRK